MRRTFTAAMIATLALSGCGAMRDSNFNPRNWFGKRDVAQKEVIEVNPLIPAERRSIFAVDRSYKGKLVANIRSANIDPTPTGNIVRVVGVVPSVNAQDVALISPTKGDPVDGVLTLELRAIWPAKVLTDGQRDIVAAAFIPKATLSEITRIVVMSAGNQITLRPR